VGLTVSWLGRLLGAARPGRSPAPTDPGLDADDPETWLEEAVDATDVFVCTTCGRSDLPEAGGWDPPICWECDAAINFDAIQEFEDFRDQ
jgi:hypothetical protein